MEKFSDSKIITITKDIPLSSDLLEEISKQFSLGITHYYFEVCMNIYGIRKFKEGEMIREKTDSSILFVYENELVLNLSQVINTLIPNYLEFGY